MKHSVSTDDIRIEWVKKDIINIIFLDGYGKDVETSTIDISELQPSGMFMSSLGQLSAHTIYECAIRSNSKSKWFVRAKTWILKEYDAYFDLDDVKIPNNIQNILDTYFVFSPSFDLDLFCDGNYRCGTPLHKNIYDDLVSTSNCISHRIPYANYNEIVRFTFWNNGDIWIDVYMINGHYFDTINEHHYEIEQKYIDAYTKKYFKLCYKNDEDYEDDTQYRILKSRSSMFHNLDYEQNGSKIYEAIKLLRSVVSFDTHECGDYLDWCLHCKNDSGDIYNVNARIDRDGTINGIKFCADEYNVDALIPKVCCNKLVNKFFYSEYRRWTTDWGKGSLEPDIYIKRDKE